MESKTGLCQLQSIDSKLWSIRSGFGNYTLHIIQRASGVTRTVSRSALPSDTELAMMSEARFNKLCRDAFHNWQGE